MKDEVENKPYFQILKVMADLQTPRLAEQRTELANALVPVFAKAQVEAVRADKNGHCDNCGATIEYCDKCNDKLENY